MGRPQTASPLIVTGQRLALLRLPGVVCASSISTVRGFYQSRVRRRRFALLSRQVPYEVRRDRFEDLRTFAVGWSVGELNPRTSVSSNAFSTPIRILRGKQLFTTLY